MSTYACSCGAKRTSSMLHEHITPFVSRHFTLGHVVTKLGGEGYPVVRRFVIRRHKIGTATDRPWVLRDRSRPAYLGHYATLELALAGVYRKVREEKNLPSIDEIKAAMK